MLYSFASFYLPLTIATVRLFLFVPTIATVYSDMVKKTFPPNENSQTHHYNVCALKFFLIHLVLYLFMKAKFLCFYKKFSAEHGYFSNFISSEFGVWRSTLALLQLWLGWCVDGWYSQVMYGTWNKRWSLLGLLLIHFYHVHTCTCCATGLNRPLKRLWRKIHNT